MVFFITADQKKVFYRTKKMSDRSRTLSFSFVILMRLQPILAHARFRY